MKSAADATFCNPKGWRPVSMWTSEHTLGGCSGGRQESNDLGFAGNKHGRSSGSHRDGFVRVAIYHMA